MIIKPDISQLKGFFVLPIILFLLGIIIITVGNLNAERIWQVVNALFFICLMYGIVAIYYVSFEKLEANNFVVRLHSFPFLNKIIEISIDDITDIQEVQTEGKDVSNIRTLMEIKAENTVIRIPYRLYKEKDVMDFLDYISVRNSEIEIHLPFKK